MLRLRSETNTKIIPCLHYSLYAITAYTLHRMGQKLPRAVSSTQHLQAHALIWSRIHLVNCSVKMRMETSLMRPRSKARMVSGMIRRRGVQSVERFRISAIAQEIATLRKEAQAFKAVRAALRTPQADGQETSAAKMVFEKVHIAVD